MKTILTIILGAAVALGVAGCNDADVVSGNISKAADQFEILRRVVFYNGITGEYMLVIEGYCSLGNYDGTGELSVTCRTGTDDAGAPLYKKDYLGLSDNVTFFVEQLDDADVSKDHYRVVFKPETIVPDVEIR